MSESLRVKIDYEKIVASNESYIALLEREKKWYEANIVRLSPKSLDNDRMVIIELPLTMTFEEREFQLIQSEKKLYSVNLEIEAKKKYIEQLNIYLANEKNLD